MGFIYKITNNINGKSYVGKTTKSDIQDRFREHINESTKPRSSDRALYRAFNKYGVDNFSITEVEYVNNIDILDEREIYWINKLGTFHYGYNETLGGEGKQYIDRQNIIDTYLKTFNIKETGKLTKCHEASVRTILKSENIPIYNLHIQAKPVYTIYNGNIIIFTSLMSACKVIYINSIGIEAYNDMDMNDKYNSLSGIATHIRRVMGDIKKSSYGVPWFRISRNNFCKIMKELVEGNKDIVFRQINSEDVMICSVGYAANFIE